MHADVKAEGRGCGGCERSVGGGRGGSGRVGEVEKTETRSKAAPLSPGPTPPPTHPQIPEHTMHQFRTRVARGCMCTKGARSGAHSACGAEHSSPQASNLGPKPAGSPLPCTLCNANPRAPSGSSSSKIFKQLETVQAATGTGRAGGKLEHTTRTVAPSASPVPQYKSHGTLSHPKP